MLKNKTIFKSIAVALIMVMMVAALSPSVGMVYATNDPQSTQVEYSVGETEWTFSVPAAQTFGTDNLVLTGSAVAISPKNSGDVISLPNGQEISITIDSANNFELHRAINDSKNSVIAYSVYTVNGSKDVLLNKGNTVLTYTAGTSLNTGVSQELKFVTTEQKIQNATITGEHTDTLTFTVNVSGGTSGGGSESGGGSNESGSEGSIGYTANFVVDANLPEIACIINGSTYKINELPSAVINVDTIEFFYDNIGAPSKGMQWDIGTSSGSNDIGTIKAGDSTRLTYTMTADTTIFIKEGSATTSTFYIEDAEYEFEEGMTWADWVNSEYNTDGFYIENENNLITNGEYFVISNVSSDYVFQDDMIIPDSYSLC